MQRIIDAGTKQINNIDHSIDAITSDLRIAHKMVSLPKEFDQALQKRSETWEAMGVQATYDTSNSTSTLHQHTSPAHFTGTLQDSTTLPSQGLLHCRDLCSRSHSIAIAFARNQVRACTSLRPIFVFFTNLVGFQLSWLKWLRWTIDYYHTRFIHHHTQPYTACLMF
jgi:hypothetical protein